MELEAEDPKVIGTILGTTRRASMPSLPPEILGLIIGCVPQNSDLCRICLSSWSLLYLAERYLYSSLDLQDGVKAVKICLLLCRKRRLAGFVRSVSFEFRVMPTATGIVLENGLCSEDIFSSAHLRLFTRTFRLLNRLTHLIYTSYGAPQVGILANLLSCGFSLKTLRLLTEEPDDYRFLEKHPDLEELHYYGFVQTLSNPYPQISNSAMPRLLRVSTFWDFASFLLPHRPISQLEIHGAIDPNMFPACLPRLTLSVGPVHSLYIQVSPLSLEALYLMAVHLPNLVDLTCSRRSFDNRDLESMLESCALKSVSEFPAFRSLKTLNITTMLEKTLTDNDYRPFVTSLGKASPSIVEVAFNGQWYDGRIVGPLAATYKRTVEKHDDGQWVPTAWHVKIKIGFD